jgi:uncharacterized protein (DUF924 family)
MTVFDTTKILGPADVLSFWFKELDRKSWFQSTPAMDAMITRRFAATHLDLARSIEGAWLASSENRLAALIVLDQFSRNIYRSTPLAFATDGLALQLARECIELGADAEVASEWRLFFYLPFEHSEDIADQDRSVALFGALGDADYLDYAQRHRLVIAQFGRFPHRNAFLGRRSTASELDYLSRPGSGF